MGRKPTRKTKAFRIIQKGVSEGKTANAIYRELREKNVGMRRKRVLFEVRQLRSKGVSEKGTPEQRKLKYSRKEKVKDISGGTDVIRVGKQDYLYRVSLILNDIYSHDGSQAVPLHSKPFSRNYLGFRLQAFSVNEKMLKKKIPELRELLLTLIEDYIGYKRSEWWFAESTYIGYEYPTLTPVTNAFFLNNKWIFKVEREGRNVKSKSGNL